jgi:uncharacterized membrane protein YdfJ with MMPL/SSD domain
MFGAFGWTFGVVEAIGLIVFVGFSVDYSLHIIEAYNQSGHSARFARVREALVQAGSAVFSAAVTSLGAGTFILFCSIKVFVQFGMVVILNTCLSMLFSFCFLCAVLMVIGPTDILDPCLHSMHGYVGTSKKICGPMTTLCQAKYWDPTMTPVEQMDLVRLQGINGEITMRIRN